jgi:hypothetical protein
MPFLSILVALASWGSLAFLIYTAPPTPVTIALALPLAAMATAATVLPLWLKLGERRVTATSDEGLAAAALRQSAWTGLYVAALLFLRIRGILDLALALTLLVLLFLVETFIQQRNRSPGATVRSMGRSTNTGVKPKQSSDHAQRSHPKESEKPKSPTTRQQSPPKR